MAAQGADSVLRFDGGVDYGRHLDAGGETSGTLSQATAPWILPGVRGTGSFFGAGGSLRFMADVDVVA